jgi:hypothetical protein
MNEALVLILSLGCAQIWTNYINRPLPKGGNGYGSPPVGSQATQGALGLGEQIAVRPRSSLVNFEPLLCVSHANFIKHRMLLHNLSVCWLTVFPLLSDILPTRDSVVSQ